MMKKVEHVKEKKKPGKVKKTAKAVKSKVVLKKQARKLTKEPIKEKHPGGRPSKKDTINLKLLSLLASFGLTDVQLAQAFGISEPTLNSYKKDPEFFKSLKKGKAISDERVERALYERATGYEHPDTDIRVVLNSIVKTKIIKHYPPDTTACIFWLKNRKPGEWRDKQEQEVGLNAATINLILSALPPEFAKAVRAKLVGMK